MKFRYEFNNGDIEEIEVAGEWYDALIALDAEEGRNNRRETRRHTSLDGLDLEGEWFVDPAADACEEALCGIDAEELHRALAALSPRQQELVMKVYFEGRSYADIAREEGQDRSAVRKRVERIHAQIKKYLE